jgi:hypothetical protein
MSESRITVDIDDDATDWEMDAVRAYYGLRRAASRVEVRISSSGSGIHLVGWFDERLDETQTDRLRRTLGDDSKRIELDGMRDRVGHATNVLWTRKSASAGADTDFDNIHDALAHIGMTA